MGFATFQLVSATALLLLAMWLFARPLPERDHFWLRVTVVVAASFIAVGAAKEVGFSFFPTITDDQSFLRAIGMFLVLLACMMAGQVFVWDCSPLTALYCCSSAYLLQSIADSLMRLIRFSGMAPGDMQAWTADLVPLSDVLLVVSASAFVYLVAYQLITRYLSRAPLLRVSNLPMLLASVLAIMVSIAFDLSVKDLAVYDIPVRYPLVLSLIHLAMGSFILFAEYEIIYSHTLRLDLSTMKRAMAEQERQFELSRSNIAAINRRCHDIRHRVANTLKDVSADGVITRDELALVVRDIDVYQSVLRTGNAALDVVLTEKGLLARQEGATLSCVADGHALDFMEAADLYALFSAILDGGLSSVHDAQDADHKSISLNVRERMGMAIISIEHYLPLDNREENERKRMGELTLQTIKEVVERYDGTLAHGAEGTDVLQLNLLIPQPQA